MVGEKFPPLFNGLFVFNLYTSPVGWRFSLPPIHRSIRWRWPTGDPTFGFSHVSDRHLGTSDPAMSDGKESVFLLLRIVCGWFVGWVVGSLMLGGWVVDVGLVGGWCWLVGWVGNVLWRTWHGDICSFLGDDVTWWLYRWLCNVDDMQVSDDF